MARIDLRYPLYDSVIFGTTAVGEQLLFQVPQGGDTTHTKSFTNARGAGFLPQNESFKVDNIGVFTDFNHLVPADLYNIWISNYLFVRVSDQTLFFAPLRSCARFQNFVGHYSQATAANGTFAGLAGDGMKLDVPIIIPGGVQFGVTVAQVTALSVANVPIRVVLDGILTREI